MPVYQRHRPKGLLSGSLIPEPGHEHEWIDEHRSRIADLGITAS
jgi:hypothetical protein